MKDTASNSEPRNPYQLEYPSEEKTAFDSGILTSSGCEISSAFITRPSRLASKTFKIWLNRGTDKGTYPLIYIYLVFI